VSKAFTREDDAGLQPVSPERPAVHAPITPLGRAALIERLSAAKAGGDAVGAAALEDRLAVGTIPPPPDPEVVGLGAEVTLRDARGRERVVRLVTPAEVGLVDHGATPTSPIGAAVLGARLGDVVEVEGGAAVGELTVARVSWPGPREVQ
jgi:regulator of nucleoside diphosphate kinase